MRAVAALLLLLLASFAVGCGPEAPTIRDLRYSPNAALVGVPTTISGSVAYTDPDNDISQHVIELYAPNGTEVFRTPPTPIQNVGQGPIGTVPFHIDVWTPTVDGIHRFHIYIIDLLGQTSNRLEGILRVSQP